jgi:hypothetical protein
MYGKIVESELLGETKKEIVIFDQLHETETYMKYKEAVNFAKSHQRGDPFNPKRFFPKSLRDALKEQESLHVTDEDQIGFYTAVNSPLDRYHGVDAFVEYKQEGKSIIITIDVTMNSSKDSYKADVILAIPSGGLDPKDEGYQQYIDHYVDQIQSKILTKMSY